VTRTEQRVRISLSSIAREVKVTGGGLSVQARVCVAVVRHLGCEDCHQSRAGIIPLFHPTFGKPFVESSIWRLVFSMFARNCALHNTISHPPDFVLLSLF
jgi:hypothetical protein